MNKKSICSSFMDEYVPIEWNSAYHPQNNVTHEYSYRITCFPIQLATHNKILLVDEINIVSASTNVCFVAIKQSSKQSSQTLDHETSAEAYTLFIFTTNNKCRNIDS